MNSLHQGPPRFFLRFFRWFCHPELRDYIEGDLMELYRERLGKSKQYADARFIIDVLLLFRPGIIGPPIEFKPANHISMYKNYIKIAWRNLIHARLFSLIKISGISIGMTACMLIFLYTKDEISFDRFHTKKDRIYRITQTWQAGNEPASSMGITNAVLGETFGTQIPEVQQYVRVNDVGATVKARNDLFTENPLFVDNNFFSVFNFPLIEGNSLTALKDPHSLVLSRKMAKKYFNSTDVLGKTLAIKVGDEFEEFTVTALAEEAPLNSSLSTDMLMSFEYYNHTYNKNQDWIGGSVNTFLVLSPGTEFHRVEKKMQVIYDKNTKEQLAKLRDKEGIDMHVKLALQPLIQIHLDTEAGPANGLSVGSNPVYSYMLSFIAAFILIIACINFINLAVAQSLKRSKEIGIRKSVGSSRKQLISQFLVESFLISLLSFVLAFLITLAILPAFNELANKKLSFSYLSDGYLFAGFILLLVITSLAAGFHPALVLSSFKPVKVLYGKQKLMGKNYLSRGLIILQFALATFLIIGTVGIHSQMNFLLHADLGYDRRNLVRIDIPNSKTSGPLPGLFKSELADRKNIMSVAARSKGRTVTGVNTEGKTINIEYNKIDDQFLPTFRIPVIAGRNFLPDHPYDSLNSVIVNESFVKEAGWSNENALGRTVRFMDDERQATVVGVIRNYHYLSLKEKIGPELFSLDPSINFGEIWVRIAPEELPRTLRLLENTYKKLVPYYPYSYRFVDEINARNYESETKWKEIISIASGLFIFISCTGLFGLVMLSLEQRSKEISIRKVLGAAASGIITLVSREFALLVCLAFAVSVPAGYLALNKWLQVFAYRIGLHWWIFASAGAAVIGFSLLIVCSQALRVAFDNPVNYLRSE